MLSLSSKAFLVFAFLAPCFGDVGGSLGHIPHEHAQHVELAMLGNIIHATYLQTRETNKNTANQIETKKNIKQVSNQFCLKHFSKKTSDQP